MRLASTLTTVAPQVPEGEKGKRAPGRRRRRATPPTSCARASRPPRSSSARWSPTRTGRGDRLGAAARQPHHVPADGRGRDGGRPLRQRPVVAARHPAAGGAAGAAALPPRGRPVRGRRRGQPPRRRGDVGGRGRGRGARRGAQGQPQAGPRRSSPGAGARCASTSARAPADSAPVPLRRDQRPRRRRGGARAAAQARAPSASRTPSPGVLHDTATAELAAAGRHRSRALDPPAQPRHLAARHDPRRARVASGSIPTGAPSRWPARPSRWWRSIRPGPMLGATPRSRARARAELERVVATLSAPAAAPTAASGSGAPTDWTTPWLSAYAGAVLLDAQGRRPRGGRLGARAPRRLPQARRSPSGGPVVAPVLALVRQQPTCG